MPTGTVVTCQAGRSQHQNRDMAMQMLRAKLFEIERRKKEEEKAAVQGVKTDIGWGHQIRSYVLHPYQMVKDLRSGLKTSDTQGVLDGDLDEFIHAALTGRVMGDVDDED
jgi:peptide chain release factor 2